MHADAGEVVVGYSMYSYTIYTSGVVTNEVYH